MIVVSPSNNLHTIATIKNAIDRIILDPYVMIIKQHAFYKIINGPIRIDWIWWLVIAFYRQNIQSFIQNKSGNIRTAMNIATYFFKRRIARYKSSCPFRNNPIPCYSE